MSAEDYFVQAVKNVETMLQEDGYDELNWTNRQYTAAMNPNYRPEWDVSKEFNSEIATRYNTISMLDRKS